MPEPFKNLFDAALIEAMAATLAARDPAFDRAGFVGDGGRRARRARAQGPLGADHAGARGASARRLRRRRRAAGRRAAPRRRPAARLAGAERRRRPARVGGDADGRLRRRARARRLRPRDGDARRDDPALQRRVRGAAVPRRRPRPGMVWMRAWARDPDPHLRRLASEGARPRLPWGRRLRGFVADPGPVLDLLELLKDDPSEARAPLGRKQPQRHRQGPPRPGRRRRRAPGSTAPVPSGGGWCATRCAAS